MQYFYDGQVRKYVTQAIRLFSNFSIRDVDGELRRIPVLYGNLSKEVASILNDNSENKFPSAPRMSVYITALEQDRSRTSDYSFVSKVNVTERQFDPVQNEYLATRGKNYTVERLMPTPYILRINLDIWTTNTDQKLQVLEQLLVLFNPTLEIQKSDNFIDWTSLTIVNLDSISYSNQVTGSSTGDDIDIASLSFSIPIWLTAPVKVKTLGIITSIITSIYNEQAGNVEFDMTVPQMQAYITKMVSTDIKNKIKLDEDGNVVRIKQESSTMFKKDVDSVQVTTYHNYDLYVYQDKIELYQFGKTTGTFWYDIFTASKEEFEDGISEVRLQRKDNDYEIIGKMSLDPQDPTIMNVVWDIDTLPSDTILAGATSINYIIDPVKTNPTDIKTPGLRLLLLNEGIGSADNIDGADAWKNNDNTDFVANANDIIEWNGTNWSVVFDSQNSTDSVIYTTNLNTGVQYKWEKGDWLLAYEGEYPIGTWRIVF